MDTAVPSRAAGIFALVKAHYEASAACCGVDTPPLAPHEVIRLVEAELLFGSTRVAALAPYRCLSPEQRIEIAGTVFAYAAFAAAG